MEINIKNLEESKQVSTKQKDQQVVQTSQS